MSEGGDGRASVDAAAEAATPNPAASAELVRGPTVEEIRAAMARHRPEKYPALGRAAAVLVPLLPGPDGVVNVLFTKRSEKLSTHRGQVSFPGGAIDPTDATAIDGALREAREEVGLDPAHVEVLGVLDDCPTFVTGFVITPVVGLIDPRHFTSGGRYPWIPSAAEIDKLHELPLAEFCDPRNSRIEQREVSGAEVQLYWFTVQGTTIWGATARILQGLIELSLGLPSTIQRPLP